MRGWVLPLWKGLGKWFPLSFVLLCRCLMLSVCSQNVVPLIRMIPLDGYWKWFPKRSQRDVFPKVSGSISASSSQDIWMGFSYSLKHFGFDWCLLLPVLETKWRKAPIEVLGAIIKSRQRGFQEILDSGGLNLHSPTTRVETLENCSRRPIGPVCLWLCIVPRTAFVRVYIFEVIDQENSTISPGGWRPCQALNSSLKIFIWKQNSIAIRAFSCGGRLPELKCCLSID